MSRSCQRWTSFENSLFVTMLEHSEPIQHIAMVLGRTYNAVVDRIYNYIERINPRDICMLDYEYALYDPSHEHDDDDDHYDDTLRRCQSLINELAHLISSL